MQQIKIVILGGGESGVGAALLALHLGHLPFVSDKGLLAAAHKLELEKNGIRFEEGGHSEALVLDADQIIKSPGIPNNAPLIQKCIAKGILVMGEIEFAWRHRGASKIVAITGSNGKSTTTALLFHICFTAGLDCALVGNIGISFARQIATAPKEWYIAEISSFQLDDTIDFRPEIGLLLNITEDHLDRYNYQFSLYAAAKFHIAKRQLPTDYFIYSADDAGIESFIHQHPFLSQPITFTMKPTARQGAFIKDAEMLIKVKEEEVRMNINDFALKGKHNLYNTMAAGIAASVLEIRNEKIRDAIASFEGLPHRMEKVVTIKGVDYIDDSKATNINGTWYCLESMEKPVILIMGGVDKGNDYTLIESLVEEKVKAIICLGLDNTKIHAAFDKMGKKIIDTQSMIDAVQNAYKLADKGDVVLLSPACASFDLFINFEDRGNQFKKCAIEL